MRRVKFAACATAVIAAAVLTAACGDSFGIDNEKDTENVRTDGET